MKAFEIMSTPVITISPEAGVKQAARLLTEHDISALPVLDQSGELVGIISEADLLELEMRPDPRSQLIPLPPAQRPPRTVAEVMSSDVLVMQDDADVAHVAARMLEAHVKRIPILRGRRLVGIVSRRDVIKVVARSDGDIKDELEDLLRRQQLMHPDRVTVEEGVVTIESRGDRGWQRLVEMLARTVPGVLEVRFADQRSGILN
jgi:CBS domain-containing protein